jgi:anaerobic selenocysteine-containing dehydrogenase
MTNSWTDIRNTDLVLIMGGNAAEAHPCGFKWVTEAMQHRKAKLVVVDPRYTRSAAVADYYAPIRVGTDIAFLGGVINYLLSNDKIQHEYVKSNTDATFLVKPGYAFDNGFFTGYDEAKRSYDKATWGYQMGEDGFVKVDDSLQDPQCVFQQMKKHYSRYTPEMVARITGTPQDQFLKVCEHIAATAARDKVMTICYALGWTQHSVGSQNIRTMAMIQLLLGNMGLPGGGVNALRGHANVQGITDMNAYSEVLSGYMLAPLDNDPTRAEYLAIWFGRHGRERLPLRLVAQARHRLRRAGHVRDDAQGHDAWLHQPGLQPAGRRAPQAQAVGGDGQAQVPCGHGPTGD